MSKLIYKGFPLALIINGAGLQWHALPYTNLSWVLGNLYMFSIYTQSKTFLTTYDQR
jgi:hypothetical protein